MRRAEADALRLPGTIARRAMRMGTEPAAFSDGLGTCSILYAFGFWVSPSCCCCVAPGGAAGRRGVKKRGDTRGCSARCIAARPPSTIHMTDECHEAGGEKETRACYDGRMAQEWRRRWWWCRVCWRRGEERAMEKGRKATLSWRLIVSAHKHKAAPHSTARKGQQLF